MRPVRCHWTDCAQLSRCGGVRSFSLGRYFTTRPFAGTWGLDVIVMIGRSIAGSA